MKISEMNEHQKEAYRLMDEVTSEYIGGYENQLSDTEGWDDEWNISQHQQAEEFLNQGHDRMKQFIYDTIISEARQSRGASSTHLKFAGKEFLMERIEKRLKKWGY